MSTETTDHNKEPDHPCTCKKPHQDKFKWKRPTWKSSLLKLSLMVVVAIVFVLLFLWDTKRLAYSRLESSQRDQFDAWLDEPLDIREEWLVERELPSGDFVKARDSAFAAIHRLDPLSGLYSIHLQNLKERLNHPVPFSTLETSASAAFLVDAIPALETLAAVVSSPHYVSNDRTVLGSESTRRENTVWELIEITKAALCLRDEETATLAATTSLRLLRHDPEFNVEIGTAGDVLELIVARADTTTQPSILRLILTALNDAIGDFGSVAPYGFSNYMYMIQTMKTMVENGYIDKLPETNGEFLRLLLSSGRYYKWCVKKFPSEDPRSIAARKRIGPYWFFHVNHYELLEKLDVVPLRPLINEFVWVNSLWKPIELYILKEEHTIEEKRLQANYQLLRLAIARQIARLEGKPLPMGAEDFVPQYMDAFPVDPYTDNPLRFSTAHGVHYSAGPDGRYDTTDDITVEVSPNETAGKSRGFVRLKLKPSF